MRTLTSIALAAAVALVLGAGQASALSSINMVFLGGNTGTGDCANDGSGADCIATNDSDELKFALTITVDSLGMAAFAFDLRWDEDGENELDFVRGRTRGGVNFGLVNPSPPPATITAAYGLVTLSFASQESTAGNLGYMYGFDMTGGIAGPFVANVSFRVAVVTFHVNGGQDDGMADPVADIRVGFFRTSGATFGKADTLPITPNFGSFQIDSVPEPGTSLLMGMGVLGLILAGRASRKS